MLRHSTRGDSIIELIVALVILEVVGAAALAGAVTAEHLNRRATVAEATDVLRWQDYRTAELTHSCVTAASPDTVPLLFPATPQRPALATLIRCGR
jgi:hypothetical protein